MVDNVTDNEIIKDLETCFDIKGCAKCSHNDGLSHCVFCIRTLLKDALGLINRQKAEIESLKETIISKNLTPTAYKVMQENDEKYIHIINGLKAEIAVLSMKNADLDIENKAKDVFMDTVWPNLIKNAKTEAVREFSVAVQDAFAEYFKIDEIPVWYVTDKILGVEEAKIKELVGDENGKA